MNHTPQISATLLLAAQAATHSLMAEITGAKGVVIATEDGFEVAARTQNTALVSRLSAMASSLAALAEVAGEESQLGHCESLVLKAEQGHILMVQVRRADVSLILSVVAGREAILGQMLYQTKAAAQSLESA